MKEFRSKLEDLMDAEELIFDPTPGFGRWRKFFPEDAVRHPAKANLNLIDFLIDKYTKVGDLILDPMAGTGSTCVLSALKGRDAICIDIEPLFYQWMEKAREIVEKTPMLGRKGKIINILGDARRLSDLLKQIDIIITSPPYGETYLGGGDPEKRAERLIKTGYDPKAFLGGRARNAVLKHYGETDVIITSPPYAETLNIHSGGMKDLKNAPKPSTVGYDKNLQLYSDNLDNIGNLPLGDIDIIITSPPYAETISHKSGGPVKKIVNVGISTITARTYSENENNIDNLPLGVIDIIITSPPYESALEGTSRHTRGGIASRDPVLTQSETYSTVLSVKQGVPVMYSPNPDNIGNLKNKDEDYEMLEHEKRLETLYKKLLRDGKPTYLSEMLKVYNEMYKVLKPNGYAIIIIKPFIRNKQVIDLPYYTWLMMKRVGFKLEKIYKLRLEIKSFWRILYYKKNPNVPRINHEYVIVCRK